MNGKNDVFGNSTYICQNEKNAMEIKHFRTWLFYSCALITYFLSCREKYVFQYIIAMDLFSVGCLIWLYAKDITAQNHGKYNKIIIYGGRCSSDVNSSLSNVDPWIS